MKVFIITFLAVAIFGAEENQRLKMTNKVLRQALRDLESEVSAAGAEARYAEGYCTEGVRCAEVCCAKSCGTCGGYGCDHRDGGDTSCCMTTIHMYGTTCDSKADVACVIPDEDECWTTSTDGRDFKDGDDGYDVYTGLTYFDCKEKANAVDGGAYYFSFDETNGFCKILKAENKKPEFVDSTSTKKFLYVNTCKPSIALVNTDSNQIYGAFDLNGYGMASDSVIGWIKQDEQRLYTALDPYFLNQVREGSVIPKVGVFYSPKQSYIVCEENVNFSGPKTYYFSVKDGEPQCSSDV